MRTAQEQALLTYLEQAYGCHTVILYGSRAQGKARETSDWDVLCISDREGEDFCHTHVDGVGEVNGYIFHESMVPFDIKFLSKLYLPLDTFVWRLRVGIVLAEKDGIGTELVERAKRMWERGPGKPSHELWQSTHHYFFHDRLEDYFNPANTRKSHLPDVVRHYMRREVLGAAFFQYFRMRGMWEYAPLEGYAYMEKHDFQAFDAFERASSPDATYEDFRQLFTLVMDPG